MTGSVLVIGGTRGTGLLIAQGLVREGASVRVLARDPARARRELGPSVVIVPGDITKQPTLPDALGGVAAIVFTAGYRSGRPARQTRIRATEYDGVRNVILATRSVGFQGRFLYMTASGVTRRSFSTMALNLYKGNTLVWRRRAEDEIRSTDLDYTIIRAGVLVNHSADHRTIRVTQDPLPLSIRHRISRRDVAAAFIAAAGDERTSRTTFDIVWGSPGVRQPWSVLFGALRTDAELTSTKRGPTNP